ncbi:hypothetical protein ISS07_02225 [Candidatus Woesearchaeota archaeon]|nr:hypothetical protein [Candidatus Woesearchaeota archaeon]
MYQNQYAAGFEVVSKTSYNIESHGDLASTASYLVTNDVPDYAAMFYSPSEHEAITSIKYGNFDPGYHNFNEMREHLNSDIFESYIPIQHGVSDGNGRQDNSMESIKEIFLEKANKEAMKEIIQAQEIVKRRKIKIEIEDTFILRKRKQTITLEQEE